MVAVSLLACLMSKKNSSWKDNEIVYCHLLTRNLASYSVRQLINGPTRQWMLFPLFPFLMPLNCLPYMRPRLNPLGSTAQKVEITYRLKALFLYCSLNNANFKRRLHPKYNTDFKCEILQEEQMPRGQSVALQPKI